MKTNTACTYSMELPVDKTDSFDYTVELAHGLYDVINGTSFRESLSRDNGIRFHRKEDAPTPITVPLLNDRSVVLNIKDKDGNATPTPAVARQGNMVISQPVEQVALINVAHQVFDHETMGTVTLLSMEQALNSIVQQLSSAIDNTVMNFIEADANKGKYFVEETPVTIPTSSLSDTANGLTDAAFEAQFNAAEFGKDMQDFNIILSQRAYSALTVAAKKSGHESIDAYMGTEVGVFIPDDAANKDKAYGYLLPKRHTAFSARMFGDDEAIVAMNVTRDAEFQATTLELRLEIDMLIAGFTKVNVPTMGTAGTEVNVNLPLIRKFSVEVAAK